MPEAVYRIKLPEKYSSELCSFCSKKHELNTYYLLLAAVRSERAHSNTNQEEDMDGQGNGVHEDHVRALVNQGLQPLDDWGRDPVYSVGCYYYLAFHGPL